ncbi:hypothetical protein Bbelb_125630 [Branchiostoma belcheri]|nr:hypothetical protein Bbelb_125630 [Branchiostoma belcheri]
MPGFKRLFRPANGPSGSREPTWAPADWLTRRYGAHVHRTGRRIEGKLPRSFRQGNGAVAASEPAGTQAGPCGRAHWCAGAGAAQRSVGSDHAVTMPCHHALPCFSLCLNNGQRIREQSFEFVAEDRPSGGNEYSWMKTASEVMERILPPPSPER